MSIYPWRFSAAELLLNGLLKGRFILSRELAPGDVFEISDPSLTQVPCDCLLLSGDCIINESMLTGVDQGIAVARYSFLD